MSDFQVRRKIKDPLAALPLEIGTELISALRNALELEMAELFIDVTLWAQTVLHFRGVPPAALARALDALNDRLAQYFPGPSIERARKAVLAAQAQLTVIRLAESSEIDESTPGGRTAQRYLDLVLRGEETRAAREILLTVASGASTPAIYEDVLVPVLHETGRLWQCNEISVAQEHIVTACVERTMAQLMDLPASQIHRDLSIAAACVGPTMHQVGARMVADAFALCGWQANYLGAMLPIPDLLDYADRVSIDVLTLSATMARDVVPIRDFIAELETRPIAPIVIVGGRGFSLHPALWRKVGADGYAHTPMMAVALANELVAHNAAL